MARPTGYEIRLPAQTRALASPLRQEIVDVLEAMGPSTIAAIAGRLSRRPDTLYFHVRALERVGLLRRKGVTGKGRTESAVYDLPGRPLRLAYGSTPQERRRRVGPTIDSLLRLARRDARRALAQPGITVSGPRRELWVARARGWLSKKDLERANELLTELFILFRASPPRRDAQPLALAFALTPIAPARKPRRT
jgi:predicted ArsR family transcriptional regulator